MDAYQQAGAELPASQAELVEALAIVRAMRAGAGRLCRGRHVLYVKNQPGCQGLFCDTRQRYQPLLCVPVQLVKGQELPAAVHVLHVKNRQGARGGGQR